MKEILLSAKLKTTENRWYYGSFITSREEFQYIQSKNPNVVLESDGEKKEFNFNDFNFSIVTEDTAIINNLKEKNMEISGYNLIQILKEQGFN